jgi:hypothetical protein
VAGAGTGDACVWYERHAMTLPTLAELLRTGAPLPAGQDAAAWETASAVLAGKAPATAAETLSEPLLLAVLDAAVEGRLTGPVEALAASTNRAVAKAARRAQYRLRSAGVATRGPAPAPPPAAPAPEPAQALPSLISPPDGLGEFLVVVARPVKGGLMLHELVISDELGVVAHLEAESSRSAWRRSLREAKTRPVREISLDPVREVLAEAVRCNLASRSPLPKGAEDLLRRLEVVPAASPPPPLPAPEDGDASLALEAAALHDEPELRGWLPPEGELKILAARVQEVQTSPLALSEQQKAEQLAERVRSMAEAFFTPERSRLYARRLWLTAGLFERSGRPHTAQVARAEARRLFHGTPGVFSRFAEALYGKLLKMAGRSSAQGQAAARPAGEAAPPPNERRTPGGLILP